MALQETQDVLFETRNNAGIIILNRPKALNALNVPMLDHMLPKLWEWEKSKKVVIIKGAGKAFCAGGDIKEVKKLGQSGTIALVEYNIDHLTGNYKIPYVALINGITMGGGMGLVVHGPYRVATENTVIAMPEAKIGLIPDVGGTYFLPRLANHLGFYLGLTSEVLIGKDVAAVSIATHFVSSHRLKDLEDALTLCHNDNEVKTTLDKFHETVEGKFSLSPHLKDIDHCFSAPTVEEILNRLSVVNNKWSADTISKIRQMCPVSLKLALRAFHKGANLTLWECLHMEYRLVGHLCVRHNFKEGVRSVLIDKDNKPQWIPKSVEEVDEKDLDVYFGPQPAGDLILISSDSKL